MPSARRTLGSANCPWSQRIQIWRWVAAWKPTTVKFSSLNSASPPMTWNWTSVSTSPADAAVTIEPSSSKKLHTLPSSGVVPPHQSGLRSNSAPVAASKLFNTHAPGAVRRRVERRSGLERDRRDHGLRVVDRHEVREVAVRREQRDHGHGRIGRVDRAGADDALEPGVVGRGEAVDRGGDVGRREVGAVVPRDALAQVGTSRRCRPRSAPTTRRDRARCRSRRACRGTRSTGRRCRTSRGPASPIGSSGPAGFCEATRMTPPAVPVAPVPDGSVPGVVSPVPPSASVSVARVVVVVTAAGGDDRSEERHRQADDGATADEVTTVDAALGVRLDQVELLWADRATCSVEALPIHALPFVQLAGDVLVGTPGRPNPNGGLRYGQPPFPVRVYRKWHHDGHGSVRERPGAESGRGRRGCGVGRRLRRRPGRERGGADRRRVGRRQRLRRRDRDRPRRLARRAEAGRAIRGARRRTGRVVGRRGGGAAARDAWSDRDRRRRRQRARHRQAGGGRRHGGDGRRALRARAPTRCPATAR